MEDLPEDDPVVSIAAGGFHSSAVTASGKMYSWGGGMNGECGHGTVRNFPRPRLVEKFEEEGAHVVKASLGGYCSAAITRELHPVLLLLWILCVCRSCLACSSDAVSDPFV